MSVFHYQPLSHDRTPIFGGLKPTKSRMPWLTGKAA